MKEYLAELLPFAIMEQGYASLLFANAAWLRNLWLLSWSTVQKLEMPPSKLCHLDGQFVKCGFAGDISPRAVFPCVVGRPINGLADTGQKVPRSATKTIATDLCVA